MKTYLADVIPKIKSYSKKLDDVTVLKNSHWRLIDEDDGSRVVYIFRDHNQLLISQNGEVGKGRWEYLGNDSLLIEIRDKAYLFKQGFYNDYVLGLKKDGINEYAILVNEEKADRTFHTLNDLHFIPTLLENERAVTEADEEIDDTEILIKMTLAIVLIILFLAMIFQ